MITVGTRPELQTLLKNKRVVIQVSKIGCPPCESIKPVFMELAKDYPNITFGYTDTYTIQSALKVSAAPTFIFFIDGKEVKREVGPSQNKLITLVKSFGDGKRVTIDSTKNQVYNYDSKLTYDVIVIGGGSSGLEFAKTAHRYGKRVIVFDHVTPSTRGTVWGNGGTCLNVGCIPKFLFKYASELHETTNEESSSFGWTTTMKGNWKTLVTNVQTYLQKKASMVVHELEGMTYINSHASFVDEHTVKYKDGMVTAPIIVLATGTRPIVPQEVKNLVITSDDLFYLPSPPGKTLCVGAGYISLETASMLNGLGFNVTVVYRNLIMDCSGYDQQVIQKLIQDMKQRGISFIRDIPASIVEQNGKKWVTFQQSKKTVCYDTVLYAIGRRPQLNTMNIQNAGLKLNKDGDLMLTDRYRTNVNSIYAVGDLVGPALLSRARDSGIFLAHELFGNNIMDDKVYPSCLFTYIEYGQIGLTEEEALDEYKEIEVWLREFSSLPNDFVNIIKNKKYLDCFMKLIAVRDRIIGIHILAPHASEMIQCLTLAFQKGLTKQDLDTMALLHPTTSEGLGFIHVTKASGKDWKEYSTCAGGVCF